MDKKWTQVDKKKWLKTMLRSYFVHSRPLFRLKRLTVNRAKFDFWNVFLKIGHGRKFTYS